MTQEHGNNNITLFDINGKDVTQILLFNHLNQNSFLLCKKGKISLVMDEQLYELQEGGLYIYPAFSQTQIHSVSDDFAGMMGSSDFNVILSLLDSVFDAQSLVYIRFHPLVSLAAPQQRRIEEIIELISKRRTIQTKLSAQISSSLVQVLCYEIVDAYITNMSMLPAKQTRKDKIFQNFFVALHRNFHVNRDVKFYAEQQNLTPRYFSTLIHDISGKTPLQWITMFVIIEAKRLLSNPKISIKEISVRLHFTDQSFFGRYFKLYAGCSPSEYRAAQT